MAEDWIFNIFNILRLIFKVVLVVPIDKHGWLLKERVRKIPLAL